MDNMCQFLLFYRPINAQVGDVLVLTKPLGTQLAANVQQWLTTNQEKADKVRTIMSDEEIDLAYRQAMNSMSRLNRTGATFFSIKIKNGSVT